MSQKKKKKEKRKKKKKNKGGTKRAILGLLYTPGN